MPSRAQPQTLVAASPAYRAYGLLEQLPLSAPSFELNQHGYPKVLVGEHFCRMPKLYGQGICGHNARDRGRLQKHIELSHSMQRESRPINYASRERCVKSRDFYVELMKNEEYPEKGEEKELKMRRRAAEPSTPPKESSEPRTTGIEVIDLIKEEEEDDEEGTSLVDAKRATDAWSAQPADSIRGTSRYGRISADPSVKMHQPDGRSPVGGLATTVEDVNVDGVLDEEANAAIELEEAEAELEVQQAKLRTVQIRRRIAAARQRRATRQE